MTRITLAPESTAACTEVKSPEASGATTTGATTTAAFGCAKAAATKRRSASRTSLRQEERFDVALEQILRHIARDGGLAGFEHLQVLVTHLGGDLVADVKQLAQVGIEAGVLLVVAQRGDELLGGPAVDRGRIGQPGGVDIDHRRVGQAQGVAIGIGLRRKSPWPVPGPSPPASARPITSSSQVVPAVLTCTPASNFFNARRMGA